MGQLGEKVGEKLREKVGEKTGEKVGESLGEIHKLNLCQENKENRKETSKKCKHWNREYCKIAIISIEKKGVNTTSVVKSAEIENAIKDTKIL